MERATKILAVVMLATFVACLAVGVYWFKWQGVNYQNAAKIRSSSPWNKNILPVK